MLRTWKRYLAAGEETRVPAIGERLRLSGRSTRIPLQCYPFQIEMGRQLLRLYAGNLQGLPADPRDVLWFLTDPDAPAAVRSLLWLRPGEELAVNGRNRWQRRLLSHPADALARDLLVRLDGTALHFRENIPELGTFVTVLHAAAERERLIAGRHAELRAFLEIVARLPSAERLEDLTAAALIQVEREAFRVGTGGRELRLPETLAPLLALPGPLAGDALPVALTHNAGFGRLATGELALICGVDLLDLARGGETLRTLRWILLLKVAFPNRVFLLVKRRAAEALSLRLKKPLGRDMTRLLKRLQAACPVRATGAGFSLRAEAGESADPGQGEYSGQPGKETVRIVSCHQPAGDDARPRSLSETHRLYAFGEVALPLIGRFGKRLVQQIYPREPLPEWASTRFF